MIELDTIVLVDSIIKAVGLSCDFYRMEIEVILSFVILSVLSGSVDDFINNHPTMKIFVVSFPIIIAVMLVADGLPFLFPRAISISQDPSRFRWNS
ncbi:integral membrane protein TerC domain protein [Leptospira inadai serovar Lyme str. 10]|uniref:Integral membrane protein TerC domain protein n=1 Tax=Leptospira inadai serovar Lyme str. 10 TaxID=1049790 RepID=V6HFL5_9LEPT|nr:integral membrane protein TerC [Leptospira inadai]EQA38533.1 integral membrane protein TerC domain protein [Leptospira inadai serovar Lyme str. 10]